MTMAFSLTALRGMLAWKLSVVACKLRYLASGFGLTTASKPARRTASPLRPAANWLTSTICWLGSMAARSANVSSLGYSTSPVILSKTSFMKSRLSVWRRQGKRRYGAYINSHPTGLGLHEPADGDRNFLRCREWRNAAGVDIGN